MNAAHFPPHIDLGFRRLLIVATGSVSAADLPFWGTWLRGTHPELDVKVALTRSAQRFVTAVSLAGRFDAPILDDAWPPEEAHARHVEFGEWAEAVLVYPCTFHYLSRFALGLADSPSLLAAACTTAPVVLTPALPPGGRQSHIYQRNLTLLAERPNVSVVPPQPGYSITTRRQDAWASAMMPEALAELQRLHTCLQDPEAVAS